MQPIPYLNHAPRGRRYRWIGVALLALLLPLASVALLWTQLAALYQRPAVWAAPAASAALPTALAGVAVTIPDAGGFQIFSRAEGRLLVLGPHRLLGRQELSLCAQRAGPDEGATLLPLWIGWDWRQAVATTQSQDGKLRNPLLDDGPSGVDVPALRLDAEVVAGTALRLSLQDPRPLRILADGVLMASGALLQVQQDLWLLWRAASGSDNAPWNQALRLRRQADRSCPVGRLLVEVYDALPVAPGDGRLRTVFWYANDMPVQELRLSPGRYAAAAPQPRREDADLFARALSAGLLRPGADGRLAVAPADLSLRQREAGRDPTLLVRGDTVDWLNGPWDNSARYLHQALWFSASGRYLRRQVDTFNARQLLAAVRWKAAPDLGGDWQADWGGAPLTLTGSMPLLAGRLFPEIPQGWQPWRRVLRWPALEGRPLVHFQLRLDRPARSAETLDVLILGERPQVSGASVLAQVPRCLTPRCEGSRTVAQALRLALPEGAVRVDFSFAPLPADTFPDLYRNEFAHIVHEDGQWLWRNAPAAGGGDDSRSPLAEVTLRAADGQVLLAQGQPTALAWSLGLATLVGLDPAQGGALGAVLGRLGGQGVMTVDARLTLEPRLQAAAQQVLRARWPRGSLFDGVAAAEAPLASLVMLDAERGDILAVAGYPEPPRAVTWSDLYSFAVGQPQRSPLRVWAWQHDGGSGHAPGAVFSLVDALLLEQEAARHPQRAALADGLSGAPDLVAALRGDFPDWWVDAVQRTDATLSEMALADGLSGARALTPTALFAARPLLALAAALGFGSGRDLDAGLLPGGLLENGDMLRASAALLDLGQGAAALRQRVLGLEGVQVTPLQLAEVAVVIASGWRVYPRLLASLNGRAAADAPVLAFPIALERIRAGLRQDAPEGVAAFAGADWATLRPFLFLKAATLAPDAPEMAGAGGGTSWLAGWLEPGALPGEARRLAFACRVGPVREQAGASCAALLADWLAALRDGAAAGGKVR